MIDVDLTATPRVVTRDVSLPLSFIDGGLCDADGVKVFRSSKYYHYETATTLALSRIAPQPLDITNAMMGCQD